MGKFHGKDKQARQKASSRRAGLKLTSYEDLRSSCGTILLMVSRYSEPKWLVFDNSYSDEDGWTE